METTLSEPADLRELHDQLIVLMQRVRQYVTEQAGAEGLSLIQVQALSALFPAPLSCGALATALNLDASNITGVVDRLEERGLLRRAPQAQDRRVKLLVVTDAGRALVDAVRNRLIERNPLVDGLSSDDQQQLSRLLGMMLEPART